MSNINIIDPGLSFSSLTKRSTTTYLIIHHAAAENTSVQTIHQWHKNKGWAGIGYNFYIRQDGSIYKGRGWEYVGSHTTNYNSKSLGICFEGNFDSTSKSIPSAQYNSGVAMIALALQKYPTISKICGHKSVGSTACPGKYFPLDKLIAAGKSGDTASGTSDTDSKSGSTDSDSNGCPYGTSTAKIKKGSTGTAVFRCQWYLNKANNAGLVIDGICGNKTKTEIKAFQSLKKLTADGICGSITWPVLEYAVLALSSSGSIGAARVEAAIEALTSAGVINTPGYWLANYSELQYLDQLLVNMSALTYKEAGTAITTVEKALEKLAAAGAINTPDYWIANYSKLQYFGELLIKAANKL